MPLFAALDVSKKETQVAALVGATKTRFVIRTPRASPRYKYAFD